MKKIFLLLTFSMAIVSCQGSNNQSEDMSMAIIEVDIFSGRPNPEFELTKEHSAELATLLESLPQEENLGSPPEVGLGFRGFMIRQINTDREEIKNIDYIHVFNEFVVVYDQDQKRVILYDEQKSITQFLETHLTSLDPELKKLVFSSPN